GLYRSILDRLPRTATRGELEPIANDLTLLADEILNLLENHVRSSNSSANESQNERHIQNSNPNTLPDLEPGFQGSQGPKSEPKPKPRKEEGVAGWRTRSAQKAFFLSRGYRRRGGFSGNAAMSSRHGSKTAAPQCCKSFVLRETRKRSASIAVAASKVSMTGGG